jgi:hypothetical protein
MKQLIGGKKRGQASKDFCKVINKRLNLLIFYLNAIELSDCVLALCQWQGHCCTLHDDKWHIMSWELTISPNNFCLSTLDNNTTIFSLSPEDVQLYDKWHIMSWELTISPNN